METYLLIIMTAMIALAISTVAMWILTVKHRREQRKWEKIAEDNYIRGQDDASQLLRDTYDKIESDLDRLNIYSDRELLTQIILSLGSYARRLDRMDEKLKVLTHYKTYLDDMNNKARSLTQHFALLENDISATASIIHKLQNTIEETASGISTLIEEIESMGSIYDTVTQYIAQLNKMELTLQELQTSTANVVQEMNTVMDTHDQSPMKKLKIIEMEINGLNLLASIIQENMAELSSHSEKMEQALAVSAQVPDHLKMISDSLAQIQTQLQNSEQT